MMVIQTQWNKLILQGTSAKQKVQEYLPLLKKQKNFFQFFVRALFFIYYYLRFNVF